MLSDAVYLRELRCSHTPLEPSPEHSNMPTEYIAWKLCNWLVEKALLDAHRCPEAIPPHLAHLATLRATRLNEAELRYSRRGGCGVCPWVTELVSCQEYLEYHTSLAVHANHEG